MNWWKKFSQAWNGNKTVLGGSLLAIILFLKTQHPEWGIWQESWMQIIEYVLAILSGTGALHKGVKMLKGNGGNAK